MSPGSWFFFPILDVYAPLHFQWNSRWFDGKFCYEKFLKPGFKYNYEVRQLLFTPSQEEEVTADLASRNHHSFYPRRWEI